MILVDYRCESCGVFEAMVERPAPDVFPCICGRSAYWTPSPVLGRVKLGEVTRGKVAKAERPTWTDTEALADRGAWTAWRKKRNEVWMEKRYQQNKKDGRKGMA